MIELLLIVLALALVVACGAFVAAEFAFVTVDRSTVDRAAESGDRGARGVQQALRHLSTQLSSAQVGITVTNLLIGFMAEPAIADLVSGPLESAGVPEGAVPAIALAIALILATGVTMIFGELVPKNLAIAAPLATAKMVQRFQRGFTIAAGPIVTFFNGTANAILRRIGVEPQEELASARSAEELTSLVRRSAEQGTLERGTATLLQRALAFGERSAHEIMTPAWSTTMSSRSSSSARQIVSVLGVSPAPPRAREFSGMVATSASRRRQRSGECAQFITRSSRTRPSRQAGPAIVTP